MQLIDNKSMNRCRVVTDIPPTAAAAGPTRNKNEPFNQHDGQSDAITKHIFINKSYHQFMSDEFCVL